jgi:hypothetical protein
LPISFDKAFGIVRDVKAFLSLHSSTTRRMPSEQRKRIKSKSRELFRVQRELRVAKDNVERSKQKKRRKRIQQEIFELRRELPTAEAQGAQVAPYGRPTPQATGESAVGALPDFFIIGAKKGGTTFLYHLLTQHPLVEHAAAKEVHFFDALFDEGIEWYRRCFPTPRWKDGRRTITGEATPLMGHRRAPKRMARVIPQARLIALLRNPADRAYSDFQQVASKGREARTFEEAIGAEKLRPLGKEGNTSEHECGVSLDNNSEYLTRSIYVDQLLRWSKFFGEEQMLVLKSENLFERTADTLKLVLDFLDLPDWEPQTREIIPKKRHKGKYKQQMDPATRQRLEEYFEPHNRRLYEYLGVDFGW